MTPTAPLPSDQAGRPLTAIVTGSDSGIGRAVAAALGGGGVDVGITFHADADGAERTADEVRAAGARAEARQLDLDDLPASTAAIDELADALGGVDVLVNRAGTGSAELALDLDFDTWRHVLDAAAQRRVPPKPGSGSGTGSCGTGSGGTGGTGDGAGSGTRGSGSGGIGSGGIGLGGAGSMGRGGSGTGGVGTDKAGLAVVSTVGLLYRR